MLVNRSYRVRPCLLILCFALVVSTMAVIAQEGPSVDGKLIANGEDVQLPYVYVYAEEKGFYDEGDPTWKIIFTEQPLEERKVDDGIWGAAYVSLGITESAEFGEKVELQVYSQDIRPTADFGGNMSGGTYPEIKLESKGPERFAGRIHLREPWEFADNTVQYDFTFSAPLSDPNAPIGDLLPADGGEPGRAYLAWVKAVHAGDLELLRTMVPAEMAEHFNSEEAKEDLEFMQLMTPTDLTILGGSSDGKTTILYVEGVMDGEKVSGEIELIKEGEHWLARGSSWK